MSTSNPSSCVEGGRHGARSVSQALCTVLVRCQYCQTSVPSACSDICNFQILLGCINLRVQQVPKDLSPEVMLEIESWLEQLISYCGKKKRGPFVAHLVQSMKSRLSGYSSASSTAFEAMISLVNFASYQRNCFH